MDRAERDKLQKNRERFDSELKIYINKRLFEQKLISEDMYTAAKEFLLKKVC